MKTKVWNKCTKKEQIARWENSLRVLRSLTPHERRKHWDMSIFGKKTDCGTVACAAGHCAFDPWFNRRGLYMTFRRSRWTHELEGQLNIYAHRFWGHDGTDRIFYNSQIRPVGSVIRQVRKYITALKEGKSAEWMDEHIGWR